MYTKRGFRIQIRPLFPDFSGKGWNTVNFPLTTAYRSVRKNGAIIELMEEK
ncbi:hypothetical protein [Aminivibrio pyruvatiphilus]|uniref:hypothetical protein n=1 Tax=Aminivibrio pyruvatiphilus TaxID=1005740 RepID=UPI001AB02FE6|nr:hypothetical protein [Aminivibrio pyruvatiphilus]